MSRGATRVIRSVVGPPRCFSTAAAHTIGADSASAKISNRAAGFFPLNPGKASERAAVTWIRLPVMGARNASTVALDAKEQKEEEKVGTGSAGGVAGGTGGTDDKAIVSYWGISPGKVTKEDGTEWRWSCFRVRCTI